MSILGKLIVNIDADLGGLRKQIREAESVMRRSAKSLGDLSATLSQNISLPLAAVGFGAIKAAADMEKLQSALSTTMEAAGRSTGTATKELEALRVVALAPGLDFEQAVRGSVRLQNVGFSAEKARAILVQLANAVAMTGGSAQELDSVTRQFGQMIAKGRILQEDLSIIQENMPGISQAMEKAFGTKSAEQLQKMGVSAEQFIDGVTKQLAVLPRVTGGLSNSIVNAFSAIKLAAAQVGDVLNKQFGISDRLNAFAAFLGDMTQKFQALDGSTQSTILGIAAFAFALGPAIKVGSILVSTMGGISVAVAQLRLAMSAVQVGGFLGWFQSLNSVMKANIFGVVIGVVIAAAAAFALLRKDTDAATKSQASLLEINKQASESVAGERVRVGLLVDTLKTETASREQKKEAIEKLIAIAPEYFRGLDAEKVDIDLLNVSYDRYIESILRAARAKVAEGKLIEIDKARAAAVDDLAAAQKKFGDQPQRRQSLNPNAIDLQPIDASAAQTLLASKAKVDALNQEFKAVSDLFKANQSLAALGKDVGDKEAGGKQAQKASEAVQKASEAAQKASEAATRSAGVYREALRDVQKEVDKAALTGSDAFEAQAQAIEDGLTKLLDAGFSKNSAQVKRFIGLMADLRESVQTIGPLVPLEQRTPNAPVSETGPPGSPTSPGGAPVSPIAPVPVEVLESYARLPEYLQAWQDKVLESQEVLSLFWEENGAAMTVAGEAMVAFGSTIENALGDAGTSWADFGAAAKKAIVDVIGNLIKLAVASAVTNAFKNSPNPLLGAAIAAIAGGLAAGLFKRLVSAAKFAGGTLDAPGGLALVGEEGPELVNVPLRSGVRIAAKAAGAVQEAIQRATSGRDLPKSTSEALGGFSMVGSNGPEYVFLPRGAQVIPAPQTRAALQSAHQSASGMRNVVSGARGGSVLHSAGSLQEHFFRTVIQPTRQAAGAQSAHQSASGMRNVVSGASGGSVLHSAGSLQEHFFRTVIQPARQAAGAQNAQGGLSMVGRQYPEIIMLRQGAPHYHSEVSKRAIGVIQGSAAVQEVSLSGELTARGTDLKLVLDKVVRNTLRVNGV